MSTWATSEPAVRLITKSSPTQSVRSGPIFIIGLGAKVKSIKSLISASHTLVLTAVSVSRIGTPAAISAALGVYTGSSEV